MRLQAQEPFFHCYSTASRRPILHGYPAIPGFSSHGRAVCIDFAQEPNLFHSLRLWQLYAARIDAVDSVRCDLPLGQALGW